MTHAGKLIPCLEEYNFFSKHFKNMLPQFSKILALSKGHYEKQYTKDFDSYTLQGSVAEGSFGLYNVNPDIEHYIFECDIMYFSPSSHIQWIAKQNKTNDVIIFTNSKFKDPHKITLSLMKHYLGENTHTEICPIVKEKDGKSIKYQSLHLAVKANQRIIFEIHCDYVTSGKFQEWPSDTHWLQTEGMWPCQTMRQEISQKVRITAVAAQKGARYSYSELEAELFSLITTPQRNAYVIFKCMFYCHVRPLACDKHRGENEDPFFTSYLAKTTFLLACEKHTPDDVVWQDLDLAVQLLLKYLLQYFEQGMLPHFARNHNLFEEKRQSHNYLKCNILQLGVEQVSKVVMNFERYLPDERYFKKLVRIMSLFCRGNVVIFELLKNVEVIKYTCCLCHKYMVNKRLLCSISKFLCSLGAKYDLPNLIHMYQLLNTT